ncbi:hypothetical protein VIM7927_00446 [Vibrio mangrovi]|uniref:Uncharacterized protein n=1 Tax=Vibrio mangrovi TaxID=474394 RepID=A0A1Y6IRU0_9VIBR|nr:hypothetical protein VIM7927_00446 [Vibrio mangrovi]
MLLIKQITITNSDSMLGNVTDSKNSLKSSHLFIEFML